MKVRNSKALSGRGRKRAGWVTELYVEVLEQFYRMRSIRVKFNMGTLLEISIHTISTTENPQCKAACVDPKSQRPNIERTSLRWV